MKKFRRDLFFFLKISYLEVLKLEQETCLPGPFVSSYIPVSKIFCNAHLFRKQVLQIIFIKLIKLIQSKQ